MNIKKNLITMNKHVRVFFRSTHTDYEERQLQVVSGVSLKLGTWQRLSELACVSGGTKLASCALFLIRDIAAVSSP